MFKVNNIYFTMNSHITKQAFDSINRIKKDLQQNDIHSTSPVQKLFNYEITAQDGAEKCKILVYFGKKGVKTVIQGNDQSNFFKLIESIVFEKMFLPFTENELDEPSEYIGTDESGKGDIFGPLVIAAVFVNQATREKLSKAGVKDSKEIKNGRIPIIADEIKSIVGDHYSILSLEPVEYNQLYNKVNNLNKLLNNAHSMVIEDLLKKIDCDTIITDQFAKKELSISLDIKFAHKNFIQLPGGEKHIGVAAASILARDAFESWFIEKEKEGFFLLKGASKEVEINAKEILVTFGKNKLETLTKTHFKPVKILLNRHF